MPTGFWEVLRSHWMLDLGKKGMHSSYTHAHLSRSAQTTIVSGRIFLMTEISSLVSEFAIYGDEPPSVTAATQDKF